MNVDLDAIECLPVMEDLNTKLTIEELVKAIDSLASADQALQDCPTAPIARGPLPVLERRGHTSGHVEGDDLGISQEQG